MQYSPSSVTNQDATYATFSLLKHSALVVLLGLPDRGSAERRQRAEARPTYGGGRDATPQGSAHQSHGCGVTGRTGTCGRSEWSPEVEPGTHGPEAERPAVFAPANPAAVRVNVQVPGRGGAWETDHRSGGRRLVGV